MNFYFFRHGETDWNLAKRCQGHTDTELNKTGLDQAKILAKFMDDIELDIIISSDLKRAFYTAQEVASRKNIEIVTTEKLRECHFGEAEGLTVDEIKDKFGIDFWDKFQIKGHSNLDLSFPGGESRGSSIKRVQEVIDQYKNQGFENIAISTHGGIVRNYLGSLADESIRIDIFNCCLYKLSIIENRYKVSGPLNKKAT
ncbi:MAG: histidine phosphatase family protein [Oligoflexia bacterium]|nr:histidine phosphatase family protein [Oligoflexia bacterium]